MGIFVVVLARWLKGFFLGVGGGFLLIICGLSGVMNGMAPRSEAPAFKLRVSCPSCRELKVTDTLYPYRGLEPVVRTFSSQLPVLLCWTGGEPDLQVGNWGEVQPSRDDWIACRHAVPAR
jgi:hypothetical protein